MFEGLKERRLVRRRNRARKLLSIEYCGDLEVLELPETATIILYTRWSNGKKASVEWRGTWLPPRTIRHNEQVLEIRRMEQDCRDYNQLFTHEELRRFSIDEAVNYVGERKVIPTRSDEQRKCVRVIVEWFRKEVE